MKPKAFLLCLYLTTPIIISQAFYKHLFDIFYCFAISLPFGRGLCGVVSDRKATYISPCAVKDGKISLKTENRMIETGRQPKEFRLPPLLLFHFRTIPTQYFPLVSCRLSLTARPPPLLLGCRKAEKLKGELKYENVGY